MTTHAGAIPDLHPLFASEGIEDVDEGCRRVRWEIFSALTEVVSGQGDWSWQSAARIRAEGRAWARRGRSLDELLAMVGGMTRHLINRCTVGAHDQDALTHEVMVLRLGDAGRLVGRELNCGFFEVGTGGENDPEPPRQVPAHLTQETSTKAHAVLAVRALSCTIADIHRVFRGLAAAVVPASDEGAHVLLPAADQEEAVSLAREAHKDLPGDVWIAVHWQDPAVGAPDGRAEQEAGGVTVADGICATLLALDCPPGVYGLDDVLVEYGATETPAVSERLLKMVEPLNEHPVLWDTLTALIAADGVRHRACERLGIHRNTLDRRLQRIGLLTGQRLDGLRGLCTLRAALAVAAVTRFQRSAGLTWPEPTLTTGASAPGDTSYVSDHAAVPDGPLTRGAGATRPRIPAPRGPAPQPPLHMPAHPARARLGVPPVTTAYAPT
ncbi:helix-turn-helix domain-containing protein [Streptomyces sp. NPDC000345]|uniref:helix-turn-helix domain-containing protein n=1 Tax=Streptomyces sp. NPDC000345 TaxID=3364537 RepID=UPI00368DD883